MATIAILISDLDTGVEVDVRSDVEMSEDSDLTPAQAIALATTVFIGTLVGGDEELEEEPSLELPAGVEAK